MARCGEAVGRFRSAARAGRKSLYVVLGRGRTNPSPAAFSDRATAREYLRFLQRHAEAGGEGPLDGEVVEVRVDPDPGERCGAWAARIDRKGNPLGLAEFSLSHRPTDPPHELEFRDDVRSIREEKDFVGYGLSPAEARASAEALRRCTLDTPNRGSRDREVER